METIIAATPGVANNYGFGCSVSHSSQPGSGMSVFTE